MNTPTWKDVRLEDEGTMDTVVSVFGKRMAYEDTSEYRKANGTFTEKGWKAFCKTVINDYLSDDYTMEEKYK